MTQTPTASPFAGQLAIGHFLRLYSRDNTSGAYVCVEYAFQNFFFGQNKIIDSQVYVFIPFGFSGISTSANGDTEPATLVFANDDKGLVRSFISESLRGEDIDETSAVEDVFAPYVAEVDVMMLDIDGGNHKKLYTYSGQCVSAGWGDTEATLELASPLDAVAGEIPTRTLRKDLVGNLPTSGSVRLR